MPQIGLASLALASVVALAGCSWPTSQPSPSASASPSAATCDQHPQWFQGDPNSLQPIELAKPTATVLAKRLVPQEAPASALICEYRFDGTTHTATLLGHRDVSNPASVAAAMWANTPLDPKVVRHCTAIPLVNTGFVVRLDYSDGTVSLVSPGPSNCQGTTNGITTGGATNWNQLDQAYRTGSWPS